MHQLIIDHWLEILGFVTGLAYLWLEYKASVWLWPCSIIMPLISLAVYFQAGLYADFGINIYYSVIAIYGWWAWKYGNKGKDKKSETDLPIIHTPQRQIIPLAAASAALWIGIWWILVSFTPSNVPVADAFTTALSIVAYWMLARKHAEQWLVWIVVDAVCCVLYVYKQIPFYAILYGLYTIIAWFGYLKWLKMMKAETHI